MVQYISQSKQANDKSQADIGEKNSTVIANTINDCNLTKQFEFIEFHVKIVTSMLATISKYMDGVHMSSIM